MTETAQETASFEDIREELDQKIIAAALKLEMADKPNAELLLSPIALAIADAYSKVGDDQGRKEIDNMVGNKLAELRLLHPDSTYDDAEQMTKVVLQLGLYKKVAHLLAGKLRKKPEDKASVVSETREQLSTNDSSTED